MARARHRGRWLWTRCPHPPGGPGSPPSPSGAHRPAAAAPQRAQDPRRSQKTQGHGSQLGRPLHDALTLTPASSLSAPGSCRSNRQAAPWGRGSRTSVHSPCVRTQPRLPWGPGLRSRAAGKGFLQLRRAGATLHRGARTSHRRGLSCCGAQAPDSTHFTSSKTPGEPSAPKLEGQMGEDGNSIKVNLIKQDDGGSPIRHYLVKYRAKLFSEWKPEIRLPSGSDHVMLKSLDWTAEYEVYVVAENQQGKSKAARFVFRTSAQPTAIPANGSPTSGLSTGAIVGILVVTFVLLLVAVDVTCYFLNKCGLLMCIAINLCGKAGPGTKGKDMEEGKATFSKDESKEPIVEVRTEEERTPNHDGGKHKEPNDATLLTEPELPADTTATVEDMLPSVTTVTANSDTITETFATAQNSPTSETTTLTASIAPLAMATPDSNSVPAGQTTPSKGPGAAATSPPPASAPKVDPLVDLSDPPTSAPAASNLSSSVLANQGAVLSPSTPASAGEAPKAPPAGKPVPRPATAAGPLAVAPTTPTPEAPQAKQEAPGTKGPDPEPTQPSAAKSPAEAARALASPKSEAASISTTNPAQGEDFKMDEGNFKTPDIDLAKDVFAALGSPAPAAGASGQAPELAPSTADGALPPAPAKTEKGPVEAKPECQETETKPAPAEVKTVPNDATQTKENESKA
ncbi:LOW QUALITY PROTEIN: neural cell adhesion molecule 1-like [Eubalaena glacialis]|uniref:LOW QUALITY PROTEIN: neural cell adhesion molecule 1-like n=1 Tax=Eubalaena glacialis TaxID=27606 RepID=UPI002A598995|nr:LOW QUALITY PROTEIN: neural cell adhesion molecule 1-like [Eubalaena glacialis]